MTGYVQISLKDMLDQFGDDQSVKKILSEFSCPLNADVERFLKNSAIEFAKQSIAPTYLVFSSYKSNMGFRSRTSRSGRSIIYNYVRPVSASFDFCVFT